MINVTSLAIDLAKNVFQLHGTDTNGKRILKKKMVRGKLSEFMANLPKCKIYMEACGSSNYWGREFEKFGHEVWLINPRYVKPYVKRNKNDANDAAAIAAAARDPDMVFCRVKSEAEQDMQSIHRIRSLLIHDRTSLANQIRGLLAEYGIVIPKGISHIPPHLAEVLGNNPTNLGPVMLTCVIEMYARFKNLNEQIANYDKKIARMFRENETCQRLATIPGVGEITATILASILANGSTFKNGRHFAAFLGLVPKQHSSGGKERLLGISKGGDTYVRTLLIHGARATLSWIEKKADRQSMWLKNLIKRSGKNKAAVALANKMARMAWAIVRENTEYNPNHKPIINNMAKIDKNSYSARVNANV